MLQHHAVIIIDCADICNSDTVLGLDKAQWLECKNDVSCFDKEDVDFGMVDTVVLSQVHTVRNLLDGFDLALVSLKEKM